MNKKRGMSIAAVLAIMICLISLVTTVFLVASRNSSLTSKSLRYIESYNEASTSIDNSVEFLVDDMNKNITLGISVDLVKNTSEVCEALFGVEIEDTLPASGELDMATGFVLVIAKEYYGLSNDTSYLISSVNFSAAGSGENQIIKSELAFDKIEVTGKESLLQNKFNATNLLWNYWSEQRADAVDDSAVNTLVQKIYDKGDFASNFGDNFFTNILDKIRDDVTQTGGKVSNNDRLNYLDDQLIYDGRFINLNLGSSSTTKLINYTKQGAQNIQYKKSITCIESSNEYFKSLGQYKKETSIGNFYVIDEDIKVERTLELKTGDTIIIKNNSIVYFDNSNSFTTNCNIYIERGSTLFVGGSLTIEEYVKENGGAYAPVLDGDFVTPQVELNERNGKAYVGGGIIVGRDFKYAALSECNLSDTQRYDYTRGLNTNNMIKEAYINGGLTVAGKVNIQFKNANNNRDSKIPVSITVYCDDESKLANLAFKSTSNSIRPVLIFCNASLTMKYCASQVNGSITKAKIASNITELREEYPNKNDYWISYKDERVGFAIITCEKLKDLEGCEYLIKANMFYNNNEQMENDGKNGSTPQLFDATVDMQNSLTQAVTKYQMRNAFVYDIDFKGCSNNIAADSVHWYIPSKLRGEMIAASITSTQANQTK